ncbi:MAG: lysophospholipid acyltransferase family protein [Candidatus Poseidoniaceae archaeon]|nr:lysophospholipid acyltransferase family protein [Candidatus Poseidoniaceae archaeon]
MNESLDDILEAWNTLEPHWKITPRNGGIAPTPGYSFIRFIFSPIIRGLLRIKMSGSERIPVKGATIFAANHLSHVDPIIVIASSRRKVHYLAKDGHFKNFFLRKFMNLTGQIETQREEGGDLALASAADVLESNCALGIFPEGTRSKKTKKPLLLPGKTGVARLAASFPHANVVPVALEGTRKMMAPQTDKLPKLWKSVKINYGQKISWLEWLSSREGGNMSSRQIRSMADLEKHEIKSRIASLYRKFTDQLMASISELGAP